MKLLISLSLVAPIAGAQTATTLKEAYGGIFRILRRR